MEYLEYKFPGIDYRFTKRSGVGCTKAEYRYLYRIVIFSTVAKCLKSYKITDIDLTINKKEL
jgi:hypothetical protein